MNQITELVKAILSDIKIALEKDPAARSWLEVSVCYPGVQALAVYRIAHILYCNEFFFVSRFLAYIARWLTGVDIHPGAKLGTGIFIDHGMGVVIGETTIVGNGAIIYQGVTLGGTGKQLGKRHPTLGNNVMIGAGAKVLGNINIGHNARVGANSVVLHPVPDDCTIVGIPGRVIFKSDKSSISTKVSYGLVSRASGVEHKLSRVIAEDLIGVLPHINMVSKEHLILQNIKAVMGETDYQI